MRKKQGISAALLVTFSLLSSAGAQEKSDPPSLTIEQVAERMAQMDKSRHSSLQGYTVTRRYVLDNKRFHKHAEMTVRMSYEHPGAKQFEVLSEVGPGPIRKRVFRKLIEAEVEAAQEGMRNRTAITPENYQFRLLGTEALRGRPCYLIEVKPRIKNKFLLQGRIWVDAQDFAIARIDGSPAETPSFWTRKVHFVHSYQKFGPFWLAVNNSSDTDVLIFGPTEVKIDYFDYRINQAGQSASGQRSID